MTATLLTQLPLTAGGALLGTLGRAGQWTLSRYMRAPLASTGLLALVTLTALAGSNALYFQTKHHPAPLFAPTVRVASAEPVAPIPEPAQAKPVQRVAVPEPVAPALPPVTSPETTGSVQTPAPAIPDAPVGNADVFAVQKKLAELQLFQGTVDGYYGPKTASAIRAFEERNGLTPMGAMDPSVVRAILDSDSSGRMTTPAQPQAAAVPAPQAQPAPVQQASLAPQRAQPVAVPTEQPAVAQDRVVARLPPLSPAEQALDQVAQSAAETIDSIIAGLDGGRPAAHPVANPPVPKADVPSLQPMALPSTQQVAQTPSRAVTQAMPAPVVANKPVAAPTPPVQVADISPDPTVPAQAPATNTELVMQIQRGLASLGFFHAPIDGKPGAETSRAIREFENFYRYKITGQVQPDLVGLLREAGATI